MLCSGAAPLSASEGAGVRTAIDTAAQDLCRTQLAELGVHTIGQLAQMPGHSLAGLLGPAAGEKLSSLAWNRDPRRIRPHHRSRSAGAQSALGCKPAEERVFVPVLRHLADRVATRLRAKSRPGRTAH